MLIEVRHGEADGARVVAREAQDLTRLSVRVPALAPADAVDGALRDAGAGLLDPDGEHAWLRLGWLRAQGGDEAGWLQGFAGMVAHATSRGWTSEDGELVRAHLRRG
ncbi:hypothetical protein [Kineococcus gypseus]|uniref:hypothetical protein n=1 Tax=Kineococcus gypseus TaxID=1637102 RepID=UPI003D7C6A59